MKTLFIIYLSIFSIMVFGQTEKSVKQAEPKAAKEKAKPIETKQQQKTTKEEEKPVKQAEPKAAKEKANKPVETKQQQKTTKEEEKPVKQAEPKAAKEKANKPVETKQQQKTTKEEEKPTTAVQTGILYECDGGKSYTLHEPGINAENHLCELDAGHTEASTDWYALNQSAFCREKLQELIEFYNCSAKQ